MFNKYKYISVYVCVCVYNRFMMIHEFINITWIYIYIYINKGTTKKTYVNKLII